MAAQTIPAGARSDLCCSSVPAAIAAAAKRAERAPGEGANESLQRLVGIPAFEQANPALAALFRDWRGRRLYYFPNMGNAGDSLIAAATYQLFRHYGIAPIIPNDLAKTPRPTAGDIVVLGGGGNLVAPDGFIAGLLDPLAQLGLRTVLLPHTIRGHEALLARLSSQVTVFCREETSYRHVLGCTSRCEVILAHDLALFLDPAALLDDPVLRARAEPSYRAVLRAHAGLDPAELAGRELFCIRQDREKTIPAPARNYDISQLFFGGLAGVLPGRAELSSWAMLDFVRRAGRIITNRLHVGIAAALVGTEAWLFDNDNGKVGGVYHHSLAQSAPTLRFREAGEIVAYMAHIGDDVPHGE